MWRHLDCGLSISKAYLVRVAKLGGFLKKIVRLIEIPSQHERLKWCWSCNLDGPGHVLTVGQGSGVSSLPSSTDISASLS